MIVLSHQKRRRGLLAGISLAGVLYTFTSPLYFHDLHLSHQATNFGATSGASNLNVALHSRICRYSVDIDGRYHRERSLGQGFQGRTEIFHDDLRDQSVVVKTYHSQAFRDAMPDAARNAFDNRISTWPTELPAALVVSALDVSNSSTWTRSEAPDRVDFVPLIDYFLVSRTGWFGTTHAWHLVFPLATSGTLKSLGQKVKAEVSATPTELDRMFRGDFDQMMISLDRLHNLGYCHNDIKPDNVMVFGDHTWSIGDLGNVREVDHPYYTTTLWKDKNQWSDCRLNDRRRMLKTYLYFLRSASENPAQFDEELYAEEEAWSVMYWNFIRKPFGALDHDAIKAPRPGTKFNQGTTQTTDSSLALAVSRELTCTTLHKYPLTWWRLGGLFPKYQLERNKRTYQDHLASAD